MIQQPSFAGLFYPETKDALYHQLNSFFDHVKLNSNQATLGIISPHAGYVYSGQLAAEAFLSFHQPKKKTCIILSPSHQQHFDYYRTM